MPELPEVETIRRQLQSRYAGDIVDSAELKHTYLLQNTQMLSLQALLQNCRIERFLRKGKYLIVDCGIVYLVVHLGMSGIFLESRDRSKYPQHIHMEMTFRSGKELYFQDVRKFGKLWIHDHFPELANLGIDPVTEAFDETVLMKLVRQSNSNVKNFLMNQANIAGIGNIYASEVLFDSKISPHRTTASLTENEVKAMHVAVEKILYAAIERFGTTYNAYNTVEGQEGTNQNFLKVYMRDNLPCGNCGTLITRIVQNSRSTFYCEVCQH